MSTVGRPGALAMAAGAAEVRGVRAPFVPILLLILGCTNLLRTYRSL